MIFDGRPESWPLFKKALHQLLDKEGYGWVVEGGDVFCAMLQAASAKAAKSTVTSGKGTVSTNVADYQKKDLKTAFTDASVTTSVLLELIACLSSAMLRAKIDLRQPSFLLRPRTVTACMVGYGVHVETEPPGFCLT